MSKLEEIKKLHYKITELVKEQKWNLLNKAMMDVRFSHNVNKSKTVIIATRSVINQPEVMEERYLLYTWFNNDMGHSFRNKPFFKKDDIEVPEIYKNNDTDATR